MTTPISGQFTKVEYLNGPPNEYGYKPVWYHKYVMWYRQKKPYDLPLSHESLQRRILSFSSSNPAIKVEVDDLPPYRDATTESAYVKCYDKFVELTKGASAEMAVNLAERKQALSMMASRATQLTGFFRSLRKGRFGDAATYLGISHSDPRYKKLTSEEKMRRLGSKTGGNYLEFHFGWSPLLNDIGGCVEILQGAVPRKYLKARSSEQFKDFVTSNKGTTSPIDRDYLYRSSVSMGCTLEISNPNLLLANQLGFVNPLALAWELVPFSFMVDWFVNVGDFLNSFTDFWGVDLQNAYVTRFERLAYRERWYGSGNPDLQWSGHTIRTRRSLGAPSGPPLRVRDPWVLSPRRAAVAVSLLLNELGKTGYTVKLPNQRR